MLRLVLFLCLLNFAIAQENPQLLFDAQEEESLLIFKDKKEKSKFKKFLESLVGTAAISLEQINLGGNIRVLSLSRFTLGVILENAIVSPATIHHDVDKIYARYKRDSFDYQFDEWNQFIFGGEAAAPLTFQVTSPHTMVGIGVKVEGGTKREYEFITNANILASQNVSIFPSLFGRITRGAAAVKNINFSHDPRELLERYGQGTEIKRHRQHFFLTELGVGYPVGNLTVAASYFLITKFYGTSSFKILGDPDRQMVKFTIEEKKMAGTGQAFSTGVDFLLFKVWFLDAKLNIKMVSATREKTIGKKTKFEYIYDLAYPEVPQALKAALNGNMTPTAGLSIFRDDEENYQGIMTVEENYQKLNSLLIRKRFGLSINESYERLLNSAVKRRKLEGNFLYDETIHSLDDINERKLNFYEERNQSDIYATYKEVTRNSFWRLGGRYSKISKAETKVESQAEVLRDLGLTNKTEVSVDYLLELKIKKNSEKLRKKLLQSVENIIEMLANEQTELNKYIMADYCDLKTIDVRLKMTFTENFLKQVIQLTPELLWQHLAEMLGLTPNTILTYKRKRQEVVAKLFQQEPELGKQILKFDKRFLKYIKRAQEAKDKAALASVFRDLFRANQNDLYLVEYLSYLNTKLTKQNEVSLLAQLILDSPTCHFEWDF